MKTKLIMAAAAVFALSSCSQDTPGAGHEENSGTAITFRTNMDKTNADTKATLANQGVYTAFTLNATKWNNPNATFDFMDYYAVTYKIDKWVYHPIKYYPSEAGNGVSFFAMIPAASANASAMSVGIGGTSAWFSYIVPTIYGNATSKKNQEDLLVASTKQQNAAVNLTFVHALSAAAFSASNQSEAITFVVKKIEFKAFDNSAVLTLTPSGTLGSGSGAIQWASNTEHNVDYTASLPTGGVNIPPKHLTGAVQTVDITSDNEWMMVLPQPLTGRTGNSITNNVEPDPQDYSYIAVTYDSYDGDAVYTHQDAVKYIAFPAGFKFESGKKYLFHYSFSAEAGIEVKLGTIGITNWDGTNVSEPIEL